MQGAGTVVGKTLDPLVSGLAADAETPGQRGNGFKSLRSGLDQLQALFGRKRLRA
jgi:hypothetical protein